MNSITRPRRRPRRASVSFRTFEWVLIREAVATILHAYEPIGSDHARRLWLRDARTSYVRAFMTSYLARHPLLQWVP